MIGLDDSVQTAMLNAMTAEKGIGRTGLQVVGTVSTLRGLERLSRAKQRPFDVAEVRADLIGISAEECARRCRRAAAAGVPLLLTVRSADEGGQWKGGEALRRRFYEKVLPAVAAADVEINSRIFRRVAASARKAGKTVIGSFHDFVGTPRADRLRGIVAKGRDGGADIVKIACRVAGKADLGTLEGLLGAREKMPVAVVSMGRGAFASRVRLARAGSVLTYGFVDEVAAPGQPSARALWAALRA